MLERTIRTGQTWSDNGHMFEVVDKGVHDIEVRYVEDDSTAYFIESDFENFDPL